MDTAKIYYDIEGNEYSIMQMVKREPFWAANRIQEGEKAIAELKALSKSKSCPLYMDYKKSCEALKKRNEELNITNKSSGHKKLCR